MMTELDIWEVGFVHLLDYEVVVTEGYWEAVSEGCWLVEEVLELSTELVVLGVLVDFIGFDHLEP
jgi:hypothetical protein